jgi:hypothetical protein
MVDIPVSEVLLGNSFELPQSVRCLDVVIERYLCRLTHIVLW